MSEHVTSAALRRRRVIAVAVILAGAVLALAAGVRATHGDRVLPGVRVEGVALGGATREEARERLTAIVGELAASPVTLVADAERETLAPRDAGYFADLDATADRALESGRGGPLGGLWSTLAGLVAPRDVALAQTVDRSQLDRAVASVAGRLGRPPFAGELVIEPGTLAISTKAPRSGRVVDRPKLRARLAAALLRRPRGTVEVPLRTRRVATRGDVDRVGRAARAYLAQPLRLTGAGEPLTISPGRLAGVLALKARNDGRSVRLGAGDVQVAALVEEIAAKRDRPARSAQISAPDSGAKLDAQGDASWRPRPVKVTVTAPALPGRTIERRELATAIESAIAPSATRWRSRRSARSPR